MKKRCIYCGDKFDEEIGTECPHCHQDNDYSRLDSKGIHKLHQACHSTINRNNDIKNSALTFLVIGLILLISGGIFLFLTFKKDIFGDKIFTPGCTEFILSVICLGISICLMIVGCIRLVLSLKELKRMKKIIRETNQ